MLTAEEVTITDDEKQVSRWYGWREGQPQQTIETHKHPNRQKKHTGDKHTTPGMENNTRETKGEDRKFINPLLSQGSQMTWEEGEATGPTLYGPSPHSF